MRLIDQFKNGKISKSELLAEADRNPKQRAGILTFLNGELSDEELGEIAAAGAPFNRISGTADNDTLTGTAGSDVMFGYGGDDDMDGGSGDDAMLGGSGDDNLRGGSGDDYLLGDSGNDTMEGGRGNDYLKGGSGDDSLDGGRGDDEMLGGSGDDQLDGGRGDDMILGGTGDDTLTGGQGEDSFTYRAGDGDDVIADYTPGEDKIGLFGVDAGSYQVNYDEESGNTVITFAGGSLTLEGAELDPDDLYFFAEGTDENDVMIGGDGHDKMLGGGGDDVLVGGGGEDFLSGDSGNDIIAGGEGADTLVGGEGNDAFIYRAGDGDDLIRDYTPGEDKIVMIGVDDGSYEVNYDAESGDTVITFAGGSITVVGAELNPDDLMFFSRGSDADDYLAGGEGHDAFAGGAGNDTIDGGDNSDLLSGDAGDDVLDGGFGDNADDIVFGGSGDDVYFWSPSGDGSDRFDGGDGNDRIALDLLGGGVQASSLEGGIASGEIVVALVDADGNAVEITPEMFTAEGNMVLPEGVSGTITGANGDVLTFRDVETIEAHAVIPPFIPGVPSPQ